MLCGGHRVVSCARRAMCCCGDPPPGYDRGPTDAERELPPDKRPWTEYDGEGQPQTKPPFKGCAFRPLLICGPACCVFELQWCRECGKDADWWKIAWQACLKRTGRMKEGGEGRIIVKRHKNLMLILFVLFAQC